LICRSSSSNSTLSAVRRSSAQRSSLSISVSNHEPFLAAMSSRSSCCRAVTSSSTALMQAAQHSCSLHQVDHRSSGTGLHPESHLRLMGNQGHRCRPGPGRHYTASVIPKPP
jgi:hypothetical protein